MTSMLSDSNSNSAELELSRSEAELASTVETLWSTSLHDFTECRIEDTISVYWLRKKKVEREGLHPCCMQHFTARTILLHDCLIRKKHAACTILLHHHLTRDQMAVLLILAHHNQCIRIPHVKRGLREIRCPDTQCPGLRNNKNPVAELISTH